MSFRYYLNVAGVNILLESDCNIEEDEAFLPFLTDERTPDIHAVIRKTDSLPPIPTSPLYSDTFCAISKNSAGHDQKFFFRNDDIQSGYSVSTYHPDNKHILIEYPDSKAYEHLTMDSCFYWLGFEAHLLHRNKLCLHASFVDTPMGGLLFSGVSGIGKSTQADLWCRYRGAKQINGDRPILSKEENGWIAFGSPYAGSSRYHINECAPITAIMLLKQAPTCSVRRLSPMEAFRRVWAGMTVRSWDPSFVDAASLLTIDLITAVPVFEFCCTPDEQAINILEAELRKECSL